MPCLAFLFEGVGASNVIVLFLVILIVIGPERLPKVARRLGRLMETFRRAADEFKTQIMSMDQEQPKEEPKEEPQQGGTPSDPDGVPQSPAGDAPAEDANPYENASPYPGNEEEYAAGLNVQAQQTAEATAEAADVTPVEEAAAGAADRASCPPAPAPEAEAAAGTEPPQSEGAQ